MSSTGIQTILLFAPLSSPLPECCQVLSSLGLCNINPIASALSPVPVQDSAFLGLLIHLPLTHLLCSFLNLFLSLLQVSLSLWVYATLKIPVVFSPVGMRVNMGAQKPINRNPKCIMNLNIIKLMEGNTKEILLI